MIFLDSSNDSLSKIKINYSEERKLLKIKTSYGYLNLAVPWAQFTPVGKG